MYRMLISVLAWGEKKRRCFLHGQIEISYYVQRFNQCLFPTRPPPCQSIIPFDRFFHGQTIASDHNYICTVSIRINFF